MSDLLEFKSHVGAQPTFFVADTGTEGGTATMLSADGVTSECDPEFIVRSEKEREWPDGTMAHALGFKVPAPFSTEGDHVLSIVQDGITTTYLIHVFEPEA